MNTAILPDLFRQYYTDLLGKKEAELFFASCQKPLRKSVRANTLKCSREEFLEFAAEKSWELSPISWCGDGFWVDRAEEFHKNPIGKMAAHQMGLYYIQEASSMIPVEALFFGEKNTEEWKVLDMAASPGSKSTQISARMKGKGLLIANEISASRTKKLFSNLERCGVQNSILAHFDGNILCKNLPSAFDAILLDAPCTGEGTVRKDPTALEYWKLENVLKMAKLQGQLLRSAFSALKPGGTLVYSTCTLSPEEDENIVASLLSEFSNAEIVPLNALFSGAEAMATPEGFLKIWPHKVDAEGFFVAKIRKKGTPEKYSSKGDAFPRRKNFPFEPLGRKETEKILASIQESWGFALEEYSAGAVFWKREKTIWMFPALSKEIFFQVRCDRIGIPIADQYGEKLRFSHEFAMAFGEHFQKNTREISEGEIPLVFEGSDLPVGDEGKTEGVLLRFRVHPVSLGKVMNGRWKNDYPRVNVRNGIDW